MTTIKLGDRKFTVTEFEHRNVLQDQFTRAILIRSGVDKLVPDADESNDAFMARLDAALLGSGKAHELVAGLLVPEGAEFDMGEAKKTAAYLATLTDPDDRGQAQKIALITLMGYHAETLLRLGRMPAGISVRMVAHAIASGNFSGT